MESRWRFNVWDMGWNLGPFHKIARLLDSPGFAVTDLLFDPNKPYLVIETAVGSDDWTTNPPSPIATRGPPFPYGFRVEADHP